MFIEVLFTIAMILYNLNAHYTSVVKSATDNFMLQVYCINLVTIPSVFIFLIKALNSDLFLKSKTLSEIIAHLHIALPILSSINKCKSRMPRAPFDLTFCITETLIHVAEMPI